MHNAADQRRHPRTRLRWKAALMVGQPNCRSILHGYTRDISQGGAAFVCDFLPGSGNAVLLLFSAPAVCLEIVCTTLRLVPLPGRSGSRVALNFIEFRNTSAEALSRLLRDSHRLQAGK